ncbi:hypothetical protein NKH77_31500 [Streptomyces sp. M19]
MVDVILRLTGGLPVLVSMLAERQPSGPDEVGDPSGTAVERFLKWEPNRRAGPPPWPPRCPAAERGRVPRGGGRGGGRALRLAVLPAVRRRPRGRLRVPRRRPHRDAAHAARPVAAQMARAPSAARRGVRRVAPGPGGGPAGRRVVGGRAVARTPRPGELPPAVRRPARGAPPGAAPLPARICGPRGRVGPPLGADPPYGR